MIMTDVIHNLGKEEKVYVGCSHEELTEWYNNNDTINYFRGAVEVDEDVLDDNVPDTFANYQTPSTVETEEEYDVEVFDEDTGEITTETRSRTVIQPVLDDDGEPVLRPKTFKEYCGNNYHESINTGKVLIPLGCRDAHGNKAKPTMSDEFYTWADYFGIENMRTKSEWMSLIYTEALAE